MKRVACAIAGLVVLGTAAASAQPIWGPAPGYWVRDRGPAFEEERLVPGPMRPRRIMRIVRSLGLDPVGPPTRQGAFIVQPAAADDGRAVRVMINVDTGQVAVRPVRALGVAGAEAYGPPVRLSAPGPYARLAPDDEDDLAPQGLARAPRVDLPPPEPFPPRVIEAPKRKIKSAKAAPTKTPLPRKRPEGTETARKAEPGSVTPLPPSPPAAAPPAQDAPTQGAPPAPPAPNEMPPVAPLE